ncbi:ribosome maturation factor RimM [Deefgea rivuli]|uniref:ribosome maturation factor RimM n=1 Tax=Deefgea rivuli TaxID=400948 RepID=UPI000AFF0806|nr:ribosome maturation factor RimM [Deefgea rivuli]
MLNNLKASAATTEVPDDLVSMGYVNGPFGIQGWISLVADTENADSLLNYPVWWLGRNGVWRAYKVVDSHMQPKKLGAKLEGVNDRDAAFALKGSEVFIPRSSMPPAAEGEYYWADLIGLEVFNQQDERLGVIDKLFETGANDVIVVKDETTERLVPFVGHVVLDVNLETRVMRVDWGLDY